MTSPYRTASLPDLAALTDTLITKHRNTLNSAVAAAHRGEQTHYLLGRAAGLAEALSQINEICPNVAPGFAKRKPPPKQGLTAR